ncbi:MAG: LysE family transporter [Alphaproteobacteria bacterium]|nr:LysE family transporter [Alphaproteobacteria bacterium]
MVPGPEMVYMLAVGARSRIMGIGSSCGVGFATFVYKIIAAFGFITWLRGVPHMIDVVRYVSCAFFVIVAFFLVWQGFFGNVGTEKDSSLFRKKQTFLRGFVYGSVLALFNPFAIIGTLSLFGLMFSVDMSSSELISISLCLALMSLMWTMFLVLFAHKYSHILYRKNVRRMFCLSAASIFFVYVFRMLSSMQESICT